MHAASNEVEHIKLAMRPLRAIAAGVPVDAFGPRLLEQIRDRMVAEGLTRQGCNKRIVRIRRIFRWGVSKELVPPSVLQGLQALAPLARGRTAAREALPVVPVPQDVLDAVLEASNGLLADMIRFQLLTACRPGEVCSMRRADLETTGDVWIYRPSSHKCAWRGQRREVFIGPRAVEILRRWLPVDLQGFIFDPRRYYGRPRLADHYTSRTYGHAIKQACRKAGVPTWGPNRLRHNAISRLQSRYGIDQARAVGGHAKIDATLLYAERDATTAKRIALECG